MDKAELIKVTGSFFAIMNPFVNLPLFLSLTSGYSVSEQRVLAGKVFVYSAISIVVVLLGGSAIISFLGITIDDFRVAGALVLGHIAWSMLNGESVASHQGSKHEQQNLEGLKQLAFFPLTFPIIVGPGTLATLIIYGGGANSWVGQLEVLAVIGAILLLVFTVFFFAADIGKVLSNSLRAIMTRLMGMALLAIAVDMLVAGLRALLPGLAS